MQTFYSKNKHIGTLTLHAARVHVSDGLFWMETELSEQNMLNPSKDLEAELTHYMWHI